MEARTITSDQKAAIEDAIKPKREHDPMQTALSGLVQDGTITEDQQSAIEQAMMAARSELVQGTDREQAFSGVLDSLLQAGTISSDQKSAIEDAMQAAKPEAHAIPKGIEDSLSSLVSDGTITKDQSDSILSALKEYDPAESESDPLYQMVEDGTITKEQKDEVQAAFNNSVKLHHAQKAYTSTSDMMAIFESIFSKEANTQIGQA